MRVAIVGTLPDADELEQADSRKKISWTRVASAAELTGSDFDVVIDLAFETGDSSMEVLRKLRASAVILNCVAFTLSELQAPASFARISGWPGFLKSQIIECSGAEALRTTIDEFFAHLGKRVEWLPDHPGFVRARILAMLINESFMAAGANVATPADIDTAMKLGTNYPWGPFEWAEKIGRHNIVAVLNRLALINPKYQPAPRLLAETKQ
ncbi:MAG TPA: 3-hydroxyacyl-CoA dehydrogenase family protein [Chitinophagaceae bacterium]